MMDTSVIVADDRGGIAALALDLTLSQLAAAIRQRGSAHIALTGGSSAAALYALLLADPRAQRVAWERVHVWQGDERFVPTTHEDSNWSQARSAWLFAEGGPSIPAAQLHPMVEGVIDQGGDADAAATRYIDQLGRLLPRRSALPAFDIVYLGVGGDGHIMSVFPDSRALEPSAPWCLAIPAPTHIEPHQPRITLAPSLLAASGLVVAMVPGAGKRDVVARILGPERDPRRWPAQLARRPNAVWLLEGDSAAGLG